MQDEIENQIPDIPTGSYKEWEYEYLVDCGFYFSKEKEIEIEQSCGWSFEVPNTTEKVVFEDLNPYNKQFNYISHYCPINALDSSNHSRIAMLNHDDYLNQKSSYDMDLREIRTKPIDWVSARTDDNSYYRYRVYCENTTIDYTNDETYLKQTIFFILFANVYYDEYSKQICFLDNLDEKTKVKLIIHKYALSGNWVNADKIEEKLMQFFIPDYYLLKDYPEECKAWSYTYKDSIDIIFSSYYNIPVSNHEQGEDRHIHISPDLYQKVYKSIFGKEVKYDYSEDNYAFCPRKIVEVVSSNWKYILDNIYSSRNFGAECNNILYNSRHETNKKLVEFFIFSELGMFEKEHDYEHGYTKGYRYNFSNDEIQLIYISALENNYRDKDISESSYWAGFETIKRDEDFYIDSINAIDRSLTHFSKPKPKEITYNYYKKVNNRLIVPTDEDYKKLKHPYEMQTMKDYSLEDIKYMDNTFNLMNLYKSAFAPVYTRYFITHNVKTNKKLLLKICAGSGELAIFKTDEENRILFNEYNFKRAFNMLNPQEFEKLKKETDTFVLDENNKECISFIKKYLHSKDGEQYRKYLRKVEYVEHATLETFKNLGLDENTTAFEIKFDAPPKPSRKQKMLVWLKIKAMYTIDFLIELLIFIIKLILGFFGF